MYPLDRVKHLIHRLLIPHKLREGDLRQRILHDLVEADDHRPDTAIAGVNARVEHAGVAAAMLLYDVLIKHANDLAEVNIARGPRQDVSALGSARRLDK